MQLPYEHANNETEFSFKYCSEIDISAEIPTFIRIVIPKNEQTLFCRKINRSFGRQKSIYGEGVLVAFKDSDMKFSRLVLKCFFSENMDKNKLIRCLFIFICHKKSIFIAI